jgi:hypothetical protein
MVRYNVVNPNKKKSGEMKKGIFLSIIILFCITCNESDVNLTNLNSIQLVS